jgi:membrane associated rhomboid family serine protease
VAASEFSANRLAPLWIVLGVIGTANLAMFVASGPTSPLSGISRYALSTDAIKYEWWRLFTGAVAHQSLMSLAINLAATWWIGRYLSPRLRMVRFLALATASLFAGTLLSLLLLPHGAGFGGLGLSGGMVGAQLAGQRRGSLGRLSIPRMQNMGFVGWFGLWFLFSSLFSGLGSLSAIVGGLAIGFGLGWLMLERVTLMPNQADPNEVRHGAIAAAVAIACALLAIGVSGSAGSVTQAQRDLNINQQSADLLNDAIFPEQPQGPNSFRITKMEDKTDIGDAQSYILSCGDPPTAKGTGLVTDDDMAGTAPRACAWITANAQRLATSPNENCDDGLTPALVDNVFFTGQLADGQQVSGSFDIRIAMSGGELSQTACGTEFSKAAHAALWG